MEHVRVDIQDLDNNCDLYEGQIKDYDKTTKDITEKDARFNHELGKLMSDYDAKEKHKRLTTKSFWQVINSQNI